MVDQSKTDEIQTSAQLLARLNIPQLVQDSGMRGDVPVQLVRDLILSLLGPGSDITIGAGGAGDMIKAVPQEYTGAKNFTLTTLTDAATVAWDLNANQVSFLQLTDAVGATRLLSPANIINGGTYILFIAQDLVTPGQSFTYPANTFQASDGLTPVFSTAVGALDMLSFGARNGRLVFAEPTLNALDL